MNMSKTEQQMQNLREALVWWQTVPEANVYPGLLNWSKDDSTETNCGTVACFGGWCARWPGLVAQGLNLQANGSPDGSSYRLFGDTSIWCTRGHHFADTTFVGTDHALVTNRIRWALEN
jgi:hypothetical protein